MAKKMAKVKRRLTGAEEFEIMKLVLDKFLWLGFIVMGWGMYRSLTDTIASGVWYMLAGAALLIIFLIVIVKEYEVIA